MIPVIPPSAVQEFVAVEQDSWDYDALVLSVQSGLAAYPRARAIFDGFDTTQLHRLEKLQRAVRAVETADRELNEGDRFVLAGFTVGPDGQPQDAYPGLDAEVTTFAARMNAALHDAITTLRWCTIGRSNRHRPTEQARDWLVAELARTFRAHYALDPQDYRANLADFLRAILTANQIPCPGDPEADEKRARETLLDLVPAGLRTQPSS